MLPNNMANELWDFNFRHSNQLVSIRNGTLENRFQEIHDMNAPDDINASRLLSTECYFNVYLNKASLHSALNNLDDLTATTAKNTFLLNYGAQNLNCQPHIYLLGQTKFRVFAWLPRHSFDQYAVASIH